jgi:acetyl esterase/lipase
MTGLPPIVMQTAGDDPIRCDALDIARAAAAAGVPTVDHRVFENLWHVFHLQVSVLAEAREAVADLGAKLHNHVHPNNAKVVVK